MWFARFLLFTRYDTMTMTPEFGFCFRPELRRNDCSGYLHLWIGDGDNVRFIPTDYDVAHDEWDAVTGSVVIPDQAGERRSRLIRYAESMTRDLRLVGEIVPTLPLRFTAADVAVKIPLKATDLH